MSYELGKVVDDGQIDIRLRKYQPQSPEIIGEVFITSPSQSAFSEWLWDKYNILIGKWEVLAIYTLMDLRGVYVR